MLNKLRNKGMIIDDGLAIELLKARGYYNLVNRYKEEFFVSGTTEYLPGTHMVDLFYYHRVEDDLINILFKFTINFEQRFKEAMAFTLAKNFGLKMNNYLDPLRYRNKKQAQKITGFLRAEIERCTDNPTAYYKAEYGDLPPWIMFSNLSLGQSRMLFSVFPSDLTKYVVAELLPIHIDPTDWRETQPEHFIVEEWEDKRVLNTKTETDFHEALQKDVRELIELVRNMISIIKDFRNAFAHGHRVLDFHARQRLNFKSLRVFVGKKTFTDAEFFNDNLGKNDLFAFLLSLVVLMDKFDSLYLIDQLKTWEAANTQSKMSSNTFYKFIKSCHLPKDFVARLGQIEIEKSRKQRNEESQRWMDGFQ
jgi:hypothetical protein